MTSEKKYYEIAKRILDQREEGAEYISGDLVQNTETRQVYLYVDRSVDEYLIVQDVRTGAKLIVEEHIVELVYGEQHRLMTPLFHQEATEAIYTCNMRLPGADSVKKYPLDLTVIHPSRAARSDGEDEDEGEDETVVHDILHQCMFLRESGPHVPSYAVKNRFGRSHVGAKHCWVAHNITRHPDSCSIERVPNLVDYTLIYPFLETVLYTMLPAFDNVWQYIKELPDAKPGETNWRDDMPNDITEDFMGPVPKPVAEDLQLPSKLQFYLKVVDIEMESQGTYEGVWHVEGLPEEHVIASGLYYLDHPERLDAWIIFKRDHFQPNADHLFSLIGQCTPYTLHKFFNKSHVPLGELKTQACQQVVFPNTHLHRVQAFENLTDDTVHRRFVAFFLVDPEVTVPSFGDGISNVRGFTSDGQPTKELIENMRARMSAKQADGQELDFCEH